MAANRTSVLLLTVSLGLASAGSGLSADPPTGAAARPIPQDPAAQRQRFADMLAWNQKTLVGAYDKVGTKDPRWDKPAREALDLTARFFSHAINPSVKLEEVHAAAKRAVDAGCKDPLVLHLYARTSYGPNHPGQEELDRRFTAAAIVMESSAYPPFRRAIALSRAVVVKLEQEDLSAEDRKTAIRFLDAAVGLLVKSVEEDERTPDLERFWFDLAQGAIEKHAQLSGNPKGAFARVDEVLARVPAFKALRLQVKGHILVQEAWAARGTGMAPSVTEEGWKTFKDRLTEARTVLEEAWKLKPDDPNVANLMLTVERGIGGNRKEMEKWFERAMKADGNNQHACLLKMEWLDPKWHGSREELLAFGRACRDTGNWRVGITLLFADAHLRVSRLLTPQQQYGYFHTVWIRDEIKKLYEEYLKHYPNDHVQRSYYAGYCVLSGRYADAHKHFVAVGDKLAWGETFSEVWMKQAREFAARQAKGR